MRATCIALALVLATAAGGQDRLSKRYGFDANLSFYPQATPKDAVLSIAKAIENKRMDYLLAHLADPKFVDEAVANYKSAIRQGEESAKTFLAFDRLVNETTRYFQEDPTLLRELRRFGKDGEWEGNDNQAVGSLKEVQGRRVFLRKYDDRWFLENKQQ